MLTEGVAAPAFTLPGTEGGIEFEAYTLADLVETGPALLLFYPFDFSPVCTTELCRFRDAEWLTVTEETDVVAISRDSCYAHSRFIEEYDIPFPLLSDVEGTVTEAFDVQYDVWENHSGVPKRSIFLVDAGGTIRYAWSTDDAYENPDLTEVAEELAVVQARPAGDE